MKIYKSLLYLSIILLLSCDKQKATIKGIEGQWNIQKLHLIDPLGFKIIVVPTGTVSISPNGKNSPTGRYSIDLSYITEVDTVILQLQGEYQQTGNKEFTMTRAAGSAFTALTPYFTKNDLQFDLPNLDNKGHYFILNR